MVARRPPTCPNCKEPYQGIYADRGKNFVGDTFIRWDIEEHKCKDKEMVKTELREEVIDICHKSKPGELITDLVNFIQNKTEYLETMTSFLAQMLNQRDSLVEGYVAPVRWSCLREDLKVKYIEEAKKLVNDWKEDEEKAKLYRESLNQDLEQILKI